MRTDTSSFEDALDLAARSPHDFTLQYPPRREYFQERFRVPHDEAELCRRVRAAPVLLLYVHVPFCAAKCSYCNFAVDVRPHAELHRRYVDALCRQLAAAHEVLAPGTLVGGIDIGGGTPTLLDDASLARLLAALEPWRRRSRHARPVSIETTPAVAAEHPERLRLLAAGGVDRVSMGLQSSAAELLESVNRRAQAGRQIRAATHLAQAGFPRINVDLIFGLPGQSLARWREDLRAALELPATSITVYDCLYRGKGRGLTRRQLTWPTPDQYAACYELAFETLRAAGFYGRYGGLNFSRFPAETGTSPYFEGRLCDALPYVGTGNYSSSSVGDRWWFAPYRVEDWMEAVRLGETLPGGDGYRLPPGERLAKQVLLSLSFGEIRTGRLDAAFGGEWRDILAPALDFALEKGWLAATPAGWEMVPGAFAAMPVLRSLFYTPSAVEWLRRAQI